MKAVDFSETIAASYLKVSRSSHLIEYMKVCEYFIKKLVQIGKVVSEKIRFEFLYVLDLGPIKYKSEFL